MSALRGDFLVCGTSTTGAGTLTLAATPAPPGGVDFDVFARATGIGFGNSAAILVSYTIIEYTSSAFTTAKAHEKGIGTLTLGGSAGIANATLARTTLQSSATSLNSQPATQNIVPGAGISIGTAANTLVFIGASAADVLAIQPYINAADNPDGANVGALPLNAGVTVNGFNVTNNFDYYIPFIWPRTTLVKRASIYVFANYTGQNSNAYGRLYDITSAGKPGKLLYDFGNFGTLNSGLATTGIVSTGASGNGFLLTPGEYYMDIAFIWTAGGSGTPAIFSSGTAQGGLVQTGIMGTTLLRSVGCGQAIAANAVAPDPAELTSWPSGLQSGNGIPLFSLSAT